MNYGGDGPDRFVRMLGFLNECYTAGTIPLEEYSLWKEAISTVALENSS